MALSAPAGAQQVGLEAAEAALAAGRLEEAAAEVERWLASAPAAAGREELARARWLRARLTAQPEAAERDYAWAAVEGGTRYGPPARLALAQLRLARGDAARALEDLERLRADFPGSELVPRSWVWTRHAREASGDLAGACEAWSRGLAEAGAADGEGREEASAALAACPGALAAEAGSADESGAPAPLGEADGDGGPADGDEGPVAGADASRARGSETSGATGGVALQLGAFRTSGAAERLRDEVGERGVAAHVVRPQQPGGWFRVRAGPFADRADALAARERLRRDGYEAILVDDP